MLRVDEVAVQLRVSRGAIYGLIREGLLPAVHVGRRVRVPVDALAAFVEARREGLARWVAPAGPGERRMSRSVGRHLPLEQAESAAATLGEHARRRAHLEEQLQHALAAGDSQHVSELRAALADMEAGADAEVVDRGRRADW